MINRSPLPRLSDEQVALADQGIAQLGAFLRDAVRQPETLNEIPSGSALAFHTMALPDEWQPVRLTAFQPQHDSRWSVRVTGFGDQETSPVYPRGMPDWIVSIIPLMQSAAWESPDDAFAAIEEALQRASELHLLAG